MAHDYYLIPTESTIRHNTVTTNNKAVIVTPFTTDFTSSGMMFNLSDVVYFPDI
jgi:hypothetical protein